MFTMILVPLDGSELARRALPYAVCLAHADHGHMILLHVGPAEMTAHTADAEMNAVLEQDRLVEALRHEGIAASAPVLHGEAGPAIVRAAAEQGADVIVMSTHGRGGLGRVIYGSTAQHVLQHAPVPVLLVPASCDHRWEAGPGFRILVPLDGSSFAEAALAPASELADALHGELLLLRAPQERYEINALGFASLLPATDADLAEARQYLDGIAERLRQHGQTVAVHVVTGRPDAGIVRLVDGAGIDLVVMATHGQGSLAHRVLGHVATVAVGGQVRLDLGSVAAAAVRRLSVPILLLRHPDAIRPGAARLEGTGVAGRTG